MKFRLSLSLVIATLIVGLFMLTSASCSQKAYNTHSKVAYNKSSRIKAYKSPNARNSFVQKSPVRKKYVIKK